MTDPVSSVVQMVAGPLVSGVARAAAVRLKTAALGKPQRVAIEKAARSASNAAAKHYPAVAQVSAEIDLMGGEAVIDEVVAAASRSDPRDWTAASERWRALYETDPPHDLTDFLEDLADELAKRLRGDPVLQPVFLVQAADAIANAQTRLSTDIEGLRQEVVGQTDPVFAIHRRGEEVGQDLGLVTDIFRQVGAEMSRGPLRAVDLDVSLTESGAALKMQPRAGADVRVSLTVRQPDTPEGRAKIDALRAAAEGNAALHDLDAELILEADGVRIGAPQRVRASAGPASVRVHAVVEFSARRLEPLKFFVPLDLTMANGTARFATPTDASPILRLRGEQHADGQATFRFSGNPEIATVRIQLKMARLGRHLKRGCRVTVWLIEPDATMTTTLPPNADHDASDRDTEVLALFEEVQRRVGAEVTEVEEITPSDVLDLLMAKRLLDTGRAALSSRGGTFTVTSGDDLRNNVSDKDAPRGRLPLVAENPQWMLNLSHHPLPFGRVRSRFRVLWPPKSVTRRDDGLFVTEMEIDPTRRVFLERVTADEPPS